MKSKTTIHRILLVLFLLALAACGTACTSSTQQEAPQQQAPQQQETTQQQAQQQKTQRQATQQQKTQQETTQQAAQATPSATQGSDLVAPLVGTWDATSIQGNSVPPGTQVVTFSADGTSRATTYSNGSIIADVTRQYTVLDDSHILLTTPDGTSTAADYSLEDDTLTLTYQGATATYQRTG